MNTDPRAVRSWPGARFPQKKSVALHHAAGLTLDSGILQTTGSDYRPNGADSCRYL
jgi:hypothetical protein